MTQTQDKGRKYIQKTGIHCTYYPRNVNFISKQKFHYNKIRIFAEFSRIGRKAKRFSARRTSYE